MTKRTIWDRLGSWMRGDAGRAALPAVGTEPLLSPAPAVLRSDEEVWLDELIQYVADNRRIGEIAGSEFWSKISALWQRGHERLATEWLEKFIAAPTTPPEIVMTLRLKLVAYLEKRGDLAAAVTHLDELCLVEEHAIYANYLLGEHYRRRGDEARALRHYEAVLARDMSYPNVRERADRLRQARGRAAPASLGETIAGADGLGTPGGARYVLMRELGRGATGVVYLARDNELYREVAVKLLHPHLAAASRASACARFFEEARISASLRHPNIMAVLDMDERARRIVMELAAGGTLRAVLHHRGPLSLRRGIERHTQILSALAAAHRRGIVHRDVKPGNLMFRRDPDEAGVEIVLGDFGVAHLPNAEGATGVEAAYDQKPAEAVGTLAYMAPEQRRGEASARSDLYAAAVVLYEMLTGSYPWPRDLLLGSTRQRGDFRLPASITAGVPAHLAQALQEHLDLLGEPDPQRRPDTVAALAQARDLRDLAIAELPPSKS